MSNKLLPWNNRFTKLSMGKVFSDPFESKLFSDRERVSCPFRSVANPTPQTGRCLKLAGNAGWLYWGFLFLLASPLPIPDGPHDRGQPGPRCRTLNGPEGSASLRVCFFTGGTKCLGMPGQDVGTHHLPLFVCSLPRRGSDVLCGSWTFAEKFLLSWLLKGWFFFAWGQTTARPLQHEAQLSKVPEHVLTCELMLLSTEKAFKTKPRASVQCSWYHCCAIQPSTSFLHSSVQICPFLPNSTPWPVYPPAHACFRVEDSDAPTAEDNHAWWFCSIKDR